ncbi:YwgA family protein [Ornithinibacillus gellani]|uniref:YwgA family protein n=1 Tax=Ornithinibacillus gellani TaxID=2293253 RepID=UPI000F46777D|nr:YwgA family protein [Ornithinibacillus gellani]TQS72124.1 YwgA family protein [Ornithinibacillus gellani]
MLTNHANLMRFFAEAKEITGRKKLQKMIYILQVCGLPFEEKYQFHFYGPYSEELSLRMEELCNLGFLLETKEDKSNFIQYEYRVTAEGLNFLEQFAVDMPQLPDLFTILKGKSARFLELAATMLYFRDLPKNEVEEKVQVVKPKQNYTQDEVQEAWTFIDQMMTKAKGTH